MKKKRRLIFFIVIAVLSAALVVTSLILPVVNLIAKDNDLVIVSDKSVSVLQYIKQAVFFNTNAADVYFEASGPIWLATGGIMFYLLIIVAGTVSFFAAISEIIMISVSGSVTKQNCFAKKAAFFAGFFGAVVSIFSFVAFIVTTSMSNNYALFYPETQCYTVAGLSISLIVFAFLTGKKEYPQRTNKLHDAMGFAFTAVFTLLAVALLFVPQFNKYFGFGKDISFWELGKQSTLIPITELPFGADYPLGISQWTMLLSMVIAAFVCVCSVIGFILVLCGKQVNWLSVRVKNWSIIFLVVYFVTYLLVICSVAALVTSFVLDEKISIVLPVAYAAVFSPFLPFVSSHLIARNKKEKKS